MFERADIPSLYQAFGKLVNQHRRRIKGLTQEKLGRAIGLSRTSITNIEKGRQHVALHHLFALSKELKVSPDVLLPTMVAGEDLPWLAEKFPANTDPEVMKWAKSVMGKSGRGENQ